MWNFHFLKLNFICFLQEEKQADIYNKYNVDSKLNHEIKDASDKHEIKDASDKSENEKEKEVTKKLKTVGDISGDI